MITATSVRRLMRLQATLTTVSMSTTEVDEMNQPLEVTTTSTICCWVAPEESSETGESRQVGSTPFVGYFPTCITAYTTSRLTLGTAIYEFDGPPQEWIHPLSRETIGWTAKLIRTV